MALSANDILKVVVSIAMPDSVVAQNVFWTLFEADGSSVDEDDVLDDLEDWIEGVWDNGAGSVSDLLTLDDLKCYVYDAGDADFDEVGERALTAAFSSSSELLAHGIAIISNANTSNPDVQGRKYWPGLVELAAEDGYVASTAVAALALRVGDWITPFTGAATGSGFIPGVWSPTRAAFYAFNGDATTNLLLGYQRRRKPGVGI